MLDRLYEDEEILIIDKPAGLPSQLGSGLRISVNEVVLRDFGFAPFLVHRLDKETSGCLIVAKNKLAASRWSGLFEDKKIIKQYHAIVFGTPNSSQEIITQPVGKGKEQKSALTRWSLVDSFGTPNSFSCLKLTLETGRMHQLRIHLAALGVPIAGDERYGNFARNKWAKKEYGIKKLMLAASAVQLPCGRIIYSKLPERFLALIEKFPSVIDAIQKSFSSNLLS